MLLSLLQLLVTYSDVQYTTFELTDNNIFFYLPKRVFTFCGKWLSSFRYIFFTMEKIVILYWGGNFGGVLPEEWEGFSPKFSFHCLAKGKKDSEISEGDFFLRKNGNMKRTTLDFCLLFQFMWDEIAMCEY